MVEWGLCLGVSAMSFMLRWAHRSSPLGESKPPELRWGSSLSGSGPYSQGQSPLRGPTASQGSAGWGPGLGRVLPLVSRFLKKQQQSQEETAVLVIFTELWTQLLGGQPSENIL